MTTKKVDQRAYHGTIDPEGLARAVVMHFDTDETRSQWMRGDGKRVVIQIQNRKVEHGDPHTAITIHVSPSETGIVVAVSEQKWLGMAADLAKSGLLTLLKPRRLLKELDDIARNVRWLNLRAEIWRTIEDYCENAGSGRGTAALLKNIPCAYCGTPNELGAQRCQACRAPLADVQPIVCGRCGFLNEAEASLCVNCGNQIGGREV